MKRHTALLLLSAAVLSGCTSIFGGSSAPKIAYIGELSDNRVARVGETIAYAKGSDAADTYLYVFKGVDDKGGIHILKTLHEAPSGRHNTGISSWFQSSDDARPTQELVFLPEQTMLVSPGVHVVFIRCDPSELQYRVIMPSG